MIRSTPQASSNELDAVAGEAGVDTHVDLQGDDVDGRELDPRFAARRAGPRWRR
jgi:hypothetical protein